MSVIAVPLHKITGGPRKTAESNKRSNDDVISFVGYELVTYEFERLAHFIGSFYSDVLLCLRNALRWKRPERGVTGVSGP